MYNKGCTFDSLGRYEEALEALNNLIELLISPNDD